MGIVYNTSIVRDGLVFAYDMSNSKKSWKGAPTTNLSNPVLTSWDKTSTLITVVDGLYQIETNNTTQTFIDQNFTTLAGTTYTFAIDVKTINTKYVALSFTTYGNWTGGSGGHVFFDIELGTKIGALGAGPIDYDIKSIGGGWFRIWTTAASTNVVGSQTNLFVYNSVDVSNLSNVTFASGKKIYAREPQLEISNFATPFVNGTRSNTQALLDWAGNNTITTTSLTYNSNGTFSFDGVDDRITITNFSYPASWDDPFSIETAIYIPAGSDWHDTTLGANGGTAIVGRGGYGGSHGLLRVDTQSFRFYIRTDGGIYTSTFSGAAFDAWYILTGTYDGTTNSLYVNGNFINSATVANKTGVPGSGSWLVGGNIAFSGNNGLYGAGNIPFVKIYSKSLSAEEVKQNFNAMRGRYGL